MWKWLDIINWKQMLEITRDVSMKQLDITNFMTKFCNIQAFSFFFIQDFENKICYIRLLQASPLFHIVSNFNSNTFLESKHVPLLSSPKVFADDMDWVVQQAVDNAHLDREDIDHEWFCAWKFKLCLLRRSLSAVKPDSLYNFSWLVPLTVPMIVLIPSKCNVSKLSLFATCTIVIYKVTSQIEEE